MATTTGSLMSQSVASGVRRGLVEFGNSLRSPQDLGYYVVGAGVFLLVMILNRNTMVEGTDLSLAVFFFPGVLGMQVALAATYGLATVLATEREDGTLLRLKSVPRGMQGYVVGQTVRTTMDVLFSMLIVLVPASFVLDGLWQNGVRGGLLVAAAVLLGLLAMVPLGFVIGSVFRSPRSVGGWGMLVLAGFIVISGIFTPLTNWPDWVQTLAQVFPLYWLGMIMRAAILLDGAAAIEVGGDWRLLEAFGVLGAWAVMGLLLAPVLLRRMARRESGSTVERRRQEALQRV